MDDREAVAWLLRRAGFGPAPGELDELVGLGVDGALDRLVDPDGVGVPVAPDPWADVALTVRRADEDRRQETVAVIGRWLVAMGSTPRPLEERMRWLWHGRLVSTLPVVQIPSLLVGQLRTLGRSGLSDGRSLLRAVTVDPAMLRYLDGATSRRGAVNENYGRELLELFALGLGAYDEADVRAAAVALTGWVVDPATGAARLVPGRHDATPQTLLGVPGVHDVDTVLDAVTAHPACAEHLAATVAGELLGAVEPDVRTGLADGLRRGGLALRPLVRSVLEAGLDGAGGEVVLAPVPWLVQCLRAVGVPVEQAVAGPAGSRLGRGLQAAGQLPLFAPNVGGWPGGRAWLTTATTLARQDLAVGVAEAAPDDGAAARAADAADVDALADALGRPGGLSAATGAAVVDARRRLGPTAALALALASPDLVIA